MTITYIVESEYYNGDKYADKVDSTEDLKYLLDDLELSDIKHYEDAYRVHMSKIKITTEVEE